MGAGENSSAPPPPPPKSKRASPIFSTKYTSRETRFVKLKRLACFEEVHAMVLDGYPISEIARIIQDERKEYTDATRGTLITTLNDYRHSIPKAELIARRMPTYIVEAKKEVESGIDELKEMESLYRIQKERIEIDFATEKKIHKLMPSMTQEIRTAREILSSYADLKMDLGLTRRHMGQLQVDGHMSTDLQGRYGTAAVGKVLADPESRRKVLGVAQRLLSMGAAIENIIDINPDDIKVEQTGSSPGSNEIQPDVESMVLDTLENSFGPPKESDE